MVDTVAGFPFWTFSFDRHGARIKPDLLNLTNELKSKRISDLFIFSHGWNNDQQTALVLYENFFGEMKKLLDQTNLRSGVELGTAGVFWPSILWPDNMPDEGGGAVSFTRASVELGSEMKKVFQERPQQDAIDRMMNALREQPRDEDAVEAFIKDMKCLLTGRLPAPEYHDLETKASDATSEQWRQVFDALADTELGGDSEGGAAGLWDSFDRLWRGAKGALRITTYWHIKARAGVVGRKGLAPVLNQLSRDLPKLNVHLIGHSFGARLVSYTLPDLKTPTPVKSLFLIQGAFSHFAFAEALPFDRARKGDLAGMSNRVDGPLLTTFSAFDKAVGYAYPAASVLANDDAAAADDLMYRWEGMGCDGAQAVAAATKRLGEPGCDYDLPKGKWLNLDGNTVITHGGPPSGAHSDIIHPQIAWAALKAAGIY